VGTSAVLPYGLASCTCKLSCNNRTFNNRCTIPQLYFSLVEPGMLQCKLCGKVRAGWLFMRWPRVDRGGGGKRQSGSSSPMHSHY
jgi:hypothetical protein